MSATMVEETGRGLDETWAGDAPQVSPDLIRDQSLRDDVVRTLWRIGGSACAGDLANELSEPMSASDLIPVLDDLAKHDVLRKQTDTQGDTSYPACLYRTTYRLAR